jgi:GTPase
MFVDEVIVSLKAGNGGNGCASFYRGKFLPKGGPNGGDGGKGGDIILLADENTQDLSAYRYTPSYKAESGESGRGQDQYGAGGKNTQLLVPLGTLVFDASGEKLLLELTKHGQKHILLKGGRGGKGNLHFKSSINRTPRQFTKGQEGEEGAFKLILKTIADIGLVGFPNAGKSSLTKMLTEAKPKTAPYPFTTLHPNVGVIQYPERYTRLLLADIPGLIAGASQNRGLGHRFLRHIERCKALLFIIDMAGEDDRSPLEDYQQLLTELKAYDPALLKKPHLIAANKVDLETFEAHYKAFQKVVKAPICKISCLTGEGLVDLKAKLYTFVQESGDGHTE